MENLIEWFLRKKEERKLADKRYGTPGLRDENEHLVYIGHYGCQEADRVVKVRPPAKTERPHHEETWKIVCPGCNRTHRVRPMWRPARDQAELDASEYTLPRKTVSGEEMVETPSPWR